MQIPGISSNYAALSQSQQQMDMQRRQQKLSEEQDRRRRNAELTQAIAQSFMSPRGGGSDPYGMGGGGGGMW